MIDSKDDSTMVSSKPAEEKPAAKKPTTTTNAKTVTRKPVAKKPATSAKTVARKPAAKKSAPGGLPEKAEPTDKTNSGTEKVQAVESGKGNNDSADAKVNAEAKDSTSETNAKSVSTKSVAEKIMPEVLPKETEAADKTVSETEKVQTAKTAEGSSDAAAVNVKAEAKKSPAKTKTKSVSTKSDSKKVVAEKAKKAKKADKTASKTKTGTTKKSQKKDKSKNKAKKPKTATNKNSDLKLHQRAYSTIIADPQSISEAELLRVNTRAGLTALLRQKKINISKINRVLDYEEDLKLLQAELHKLQQTVQNKAQRVVILFEGRDAAGKGGTIRRFTEHLNPRTIRVVALPIPTKEETGQWYFQRYIKQLPNRGEIVFFDRSWYNRAVVEPVNGFCTKDDYRRFMLQVPEFEQMLFAEGIHLIKFYFSITKREQVKRFKARENNPLKQWKLSPLDAKAQQLWDEYTHYKEMMFNRTHSTSCPWILVHANNKMKARLESIRYVLSTHEYEGKDESKIRLYPDVNTVQRYQQGSTF